ncbi:MAG: hypothetical protein HKN92_03415 [Chitinophagales bacterium]|nr:hypothetical protein [Chitinophagales bacterium]
MYWVYSALLIGAIHLITFPVPAQSNNSDDKNYETLESYVKEITELQSGTNSNVSINNIKQLLLQNKSEAFFKAMMAYEILSDMKTAEKDQTTFSSNHLIFLEDYLIQLNKSTLDQYLEENPLLAIHNFRYLSAYSGIESFLVNYISVYPLDILNIYPEIQKRNYNLKILDKLCSVIPSIVKDYLGSNHIIKRDFMKLSSENARVLKQIYLNDPNDNKLYAFAEEIKNSSLTIKEARSICDDNGRYFQEMVKSFLSNEHYIRHSLNALLKEESLKLMRALNDDHMNTNFESRFKPVSHLTSQELYVLLIQSEEEVFTSTFNGLYEILTAKIQGDATAFLSSVNYREFRSFLRLLASFGKLENWLELINDSDRSELLNRFVSSLETYRTLDEAITVADAIGSISDEILKADLNREIQDQFSRCRHHKQERGIAIYRVLKSLASIDDLSLFQDQYAITSIDKIERSELFNSNGKHIQQHYFYDDDDGRESFASFIAQFSSQWLISDKGTYIIISPVRNPDILMFVNKPEFETDGHQDIREYLMINKMSPQVIVHRGHSFYSDKTIRHIDASTKIAIIGSCGSYHSIYKVLEKSAEIHVISSKQIASQHVNNPLLLLLAKAIMTERDLEWPIFWEALKTNLSQNRYASEKFVDYVPPHKNLGILFVRAYDKVRTGQ